MTKPTRTDSSISVPRETLDQLKAVQEALRARLGFTPTIRQTLEHLMKLALDDQRNDH